MTILWDFNIYCCIIISAYQPDFTIVERHKNLVTLVDVAISADKRILEKEQEKIMKYQDLRIELEHLWNKLKKIKIKCETKCNIKVTGYRIPWDTEVGFISKKVAFHKM